MSTVLTTSDEMVAYFAESDNVLRGGGPEMVSSRIEFADGAQGNILFCGEGVSLVGTRISFNGSNAVVFIEGPNRALRLGVTVWSASVFAIGSGTYTNGVFNAIASERRSIVLGKRGLFSFGLWVRTADPHLVYSAQTKRRLNPSRDVLVGDHVWLGQDAMLLKGATIGSGSIIGAKAVVAGKKVPSNTSWAGNPARQVAAGVLFDSASVHNYSEADTEHSRVYESDRWTYQGPTSAEASGLVRLGDRLFAFGNDAHAKYELLAQSFSDGTKDRFAFGGVSVSSTPTRKVGLTAKLKRTVKRIL